MAYCVLFWFTLLLVDCVCLCLTRGLVLVVCFGIAGWWFGFSDFVCFVIGFRGLLCCFVIFGCTVTG